MIRDVAYQGVLKEARADFHERFADWLERTAGERAGEFEEILGHHLERACSVPRRARPAGRPRTRAVGAGGGPARVLGEAGAGPGRHRAGGEAAGPGGDAVARRRPGQAGSGPEAGHRPGRDRGGLPRRRAAPGPDRGRAAGARLRGVQRSDRQAPRGRPRRRDRDRHGRPARGARRGAELGHRGLAPTRRAAPHRGGLGAGRRVVQQRLVPQRRAHAGRARRFGTATSCASATPSCCSGPPRRSPGRWSPSSPGRRPIMGPRPNEFRTPPHSENE